MNLPNPFNPSPAAAALTTPAASPAHDPWAVGQAMAAIEGQRSVLGDAVTELALEPLRALLVTAEQGAAAEAAPQLRRAQVTVLFADIVDSTMLASRLDAEDVLQVFGTVLERAAACVRARGGHVLRYTGDGIKAGFGTQGTREDDAAQAVLAGLDILAAGAEHAQWVARAHGVAGFALRVGAHTGEVALGAGFESDNTLSGEAVNIAARMEQAAPPGTLRISAATYAHVRGQFVVDAQAPLQVKGVEAPLQTYLVQAAKPRHFRIVSRGIEGVATQMIGRQAELATLQAAFAGLFEQRRFAAVTVVGEAGIGKSRLLYEFEAWRELQPQRFSLFRGRATPQTQGQVFGLLRDIVAWRLQITDDDSVQAARAKIEQGIVPPLPDEGAEQAQASAHLLGHLIGIDWRDSPHVRGILEDPQQIRNRAFHAAAQWLRRVGATDSGPVLLQLEDLHWADSESLDFLDHLARASHDAPLLQMAFTRPTLFERRAGWAGDGSIHQRLDLAPLGPGSSDALALELLQRLPQADPALNDLLTRSAEGNPFYMEELVKMLIDRGAIETGRTWRVNPQRLVITKVPTTLTGVLQARLDSLPGPEKRALQRASIVGTVFWDQALAAVEPEATAQLPALERRRLTLPRADGALEGLCEYAFHHQLLQQVTYGTVLKADKRDGHAKVAQWLAALTGLRAGDFLGTAAEHFQKAGDMANAVEFHARAAEQAGQRFAHERLLAHVQCALELLGEPTAAQAEMRWRLLIARDKPLALQGRRDEQGADLDAQAQLAEILDDDLRRADVARRRGGRALRMNDLPLAETEALRTIDCATRAGDDNLRVFGLGLLAFARVEQGAIEAGSELAHQGLDQARRLGLRRAEGFLLNVLGHVVGKRGDLLAALDIRQQNLKLVRERGDRLAEAVSLLNIGDGWLKLGDLTRARSGLDEALHLLRANGDQVLEGAALSQLSALALWQGDAARALALAGAALSIANRTQAGARQEQMIAALRSADACRALGRLAEARRACAEAMALALHGNNPARHAASATLARLALDMGDPDAALSELQPVLDHVAAGGTLVGTEFPSRIELTAYQVLAHTGDRRSDDWLKRAHTALLTQADAITDLSLRQGFLLNIPQHRDIVAAWRVAHPAGAVT